MSFLQVLTISILSALLVVGVTTFWGGRADAHGRWSAADDAGSHFHHGRGDGHGWHGRRGWHLCNEQRLERAERMLTHIRDSLELTDQQEPAWSALNDAVYAGGEMITTACEQWSQDSEAVPERLERVETMLATGLDALRQVRPPFEEFYAVLTDAQRATLDNLIRHRRQWSEVDFSPGREISLPAGFAGALCNASDPRCTTPPLRFNAVVVGKIP